MSDHSTNLPAGGQTTAALAAPGSAYTVPAQPEPVPGNGDRLWVHTAWEAVLLVLLVGGIGLWWLSSGTVPDLLRDQALLADQLYAMAPFLLLGTALAISLRVRAANLAVGGVALLAAVLFLEWEGEHRLVAAGLVAAAGLAAGAALLVLVVWLRLPGWAASLGAALAAVATAITINPELGGPLGLVPQSTTVTTAEELVWVVVGTVMAASVLGGVVGMLPAVRRRLQDCRDAADRPDRADQGSVDRDPADPDRGRRPGRVAVTTGSALIASSLLAAAAGVLVVIPAEGASSGTGLAVGPLESAGIALPLAIALLGGTSPWGKRGGVFGTLLAALALFAGLVIFNDLGWSGQSHWVVVAALVLGLLVSTLVERSGTGRPAEPPEPEPEPAMPAESEPAEPRAAEPPVPAGSGVAR